MSRFSRPALLVFAVALSLSAQDWTTAQTLSGVDFAGLSASQRASALKILRQNGCSCGCQMKLAECRVKDPGCGYSTNLAAEVVRSLKAGKSESETTAALQASPWSHVQQEAKLLDDPVQISTYGSTSTRPRQSSHHPGRIF